MKYFETKVVKIKPKRTLQINPRGAGKSTKYWGYLSDEKLERLQIDIRRESERRKTIESKKGNWVNGENLDKIKFPCFCRFRIGKRKRLGQINNDFFKGYEQYTLSTIDRQVGNNETTAWCRYDNLKQLIKNNEVKILKGKITIFNDDLEDKYNDD